VAWWPHVSAVIEPLCLAWW